MTLILRTMKKHMGWEDAKDDYVVLDGEKSVGRICKEAHGDSGGAGQSTRARIRHHRCITASPKFSTQQSKNSKPDIRK
jgi:hypothetical protein